ncbi:MAG: CBS domain-containing protein [Bacteroidetes bacterium]|jgi:acetoin utilization protein AcuB|nr:CBS domain-containing protein [Bacteroidota bacterium]
MTIRDIMTTDLITVTPDETLMEVDALFRTHGVRHLPVEENGHLVGILSDRDVLRSVSPFVDTPSESPRDVRTLQRVAREMMKEDPLCIHPDASLSEAARTLLEQGINSLPVVEEGGDLVGIVTTRDILWHMSQEHA